jgi:signal transduction histidine kinase
MSHELRTPMNGVMGMMDLALRRATDTKQREHLATGQEAARHLLAIVNDVLDFARLEAGDLALVPGTFTLSALLEGLTTDYAPEAARKGLWFSVEVAPAIATQAFTGDAARLGQVLRHLVANAIKFTPAGSVTLRAMSAARDADGVSVRFEVEDTGIGIAREDHARLFRDFEQLDSSRTRAYGGAGLGLAIVRRLVHLMGGEIGMQTEPAAGSTFWCTVRLGVPSGATTADAVRPADAASRQRHPPTGDLHQS